MKILQNVLPFFLYMTLIIPTGCSSPKKNDRSIHNENITNINIQEEITQDTMKKLKHVLIQTNLGDIIIALYDETPLHRDNFIKLVNENYYDGILFHRIIKGFMIQAGDPDSKTATPAQQLGSGGPGYTIPAEFNPSLIHKRGAVAAARTGDHLNPKKASSGSQFYIVDGQKWSMQDMNSIAMQTGKQFSEKAMATYTSVGGAPFLDGDYTVFGEVIEGLDVVDKIAAQEKNQADRPKTDIVIRSMKIIEP